MTPEDRRKIELAIESTAGGYLRNMVSQESCARCFTPLAGSVTLCSRCSADAHLGRLPEVVGFLSYASLDAPIEQSGRVMYGYKYAQPMPSVQRTVQLLAALGLRGHTECVQRLTGHPVTCWATVPSLKRRPGVHPLNSIVAALSRPGSIELQLQAAPDAALYARELRAMNFEVVSEVPADAHVLLVDDTWTSGGHVQSAALALRAAGAARVSVLSLARWLTVGFGYTTDRWMRRLTKDYDASVCPYTRADCPRETTEW